MQPGKGQKKNGFTLLMGRSSSMVQPSIHMMYGLCVSWTGTGRRNFPEQWICLRGLAGCEGSLFWDFAR